ncbi:hypothetical protein ABTZ57_01485 [Streptomyces sp. NPDC094048]|uniref:hypothetical protein n=1 Tax=unclassified Streptomyces TaxID=2593676 RepID=UPI003326016A
MAITAYPINAAAGAPAYSSQQFRQALTALLNPGGIGLRAQPGVRPGSGLGVTISGSTLTISTGAGVVQGGSSGTQGPYLLVSDTPVTKTVDAAAATNSRVDLVYARIRDTDADASGARDGDILYLAGTPAASPVAPTPSDPSYITLATVNVPAVGGGSPVVSYSMRAYTAAAGGLTIGQVAPPAPYTGQLWDSGDGPRRWDGTQWRYLRYDPQVSNQSSAPSSYGTTGAWVDFTSAQWTPITFVVPPSRMVWVSIGAAIQNTTTATSTVWVGWRASGGYTRAANESNAISTWGSRIYSDRRILLTGLTAGASVVITPQWNVSSAGTVGSVTRTTDGQLTVEPIA